MARIFVLRRSSLILIGALAVVAIIGMFYVQSLFANTTAMATSQTAEYHIAIVEFEAKTADGREYDVYRFDPGTIYVQHGQQVTLTFHGVHGSHHPIEIEGYNIRNAVAKGESTSISFTADQKGTFRIICSTHSGHDSSVPMIGYLVVN